MRRKPNLKSSQRFVMYIPNNLRAEIEGWVSKMGITLADFGRDAFIKYLDEIKRQERNAQLAETCRFFESNNVSVYREWASADKENWAA